MTISKIETDKHGTVRYWFNGKLHREDGPSVIYADGAETWYFNGKRHRTDGPAIKWTSGAICWFWAGDRYSFEEYVKVAKWTDEEIVMYKLTHF